MDDNKKKLKAVEAIFNLALSTADDINIHIWCTLPGGLIRGKPITPNEYFELMLGEEILLSKKQAKENKTPEQKRFFHLKKVTIMLGNISNHFNVAVMDGLEVGSWGLYDAAVTTG